MASSDIIVVWKGEKGNPSFGFSTLQQPADRRYLPVSRAQFTADGEHLVVLSTDRGLPTGLNVDRNISRMQASGTLVPAGGSALSGSRPRRDRAGRSFTIAR